MKQRECIGCTNAVTGRNKKCDDCKKTCVACRSDLEMYGGSMKCKRCVRERQAEWYADNKDTIRLSQTMKMYGMTKNEAISMRGARSCEVCGSEPYGRGGLHVDHDHVTGKVRGILCHGCNLALGNAKDDAAILRALADYLESK